MHSQLPAISINKLGEFVNASNARKWTIVKDIKCSAKIKCARYMPAKSAITEFMLDDNHDIGILKFKKSHIVINSGDSGWKKDDKRCSVQAIEKFESSSKNILLPYLKQKTKKLLLADCKNMEFRGVIIHLNPDFVIIDREQNAVSGAIKLVFSKNRCVTPFEGQIISGSIQKHMERVFQKRIETENCITIDVFQKRIIQSPDDFNYHRIRLISACEEICKIWPKI